MEGKINFWIPVIGNGWIPWTGDTICKVNIWDPGKDNVLTSANGYA